MCTGVIHPDPAIDQVPLGIEDPDPLQVLATEAEQVPTGNEPSKAHEESSGRVAALLMSNQKGVTCNQQVFWVFINSKMRTTSWDNALMDGLWTLFTSS